MIVSLLLLFYPIPTRSWNKRGKRRVRRSATAKLHNFVLQKFISGRLTKQTNSIDRTQLILHKYYRPNFRDNAIRTFNGLFAEYDWKNSEIASH
jgi:hypothetical protein